MTTPGMWIGLRAVPTYTVAVNPSGPTAGMWIGMRAVPTYALPVVNPVVLISRTLTAKARPLAHTAKAHALTHTAITRLLAHTAKEQP